MRRVLAVGDGRLAGLRAAGAEVVLAGDAAEAARALEAAGEEAGLVVLTPELAESLHDWLARRPRLLWTVVTP